MSEEEKKAVEKIGKELRLRTQAQLEIVEKDAGIDEVKLITEELGNMAFLIHIIDKLQKENEELKYENLNLKEEKMIDNSSCKPLNNFYDYYDCIPKGKIREKLEYKKDKLKQLKYSSDRYRKVCLQAEIDALEELLEEE